MLNVVLALFQTIQNIGYLSIFVSYRTGQIIVNFLLTSFEVLCKIYDTLWTVIIILNEDLFVFLADLGSRLSSITSSILNLIEYVGETVISFISLLKSIVFGACYLTVTFVQTIADVIIKVFSSAGNLIAVLKQLIVLFGSGAWFAITLVPVFILYISMMTTYYIGRAFEETKTMCVSTFIQLESSVLDLITFVTDVPVESVLGLLMISCVGYVMAKCHLAVYQLLARLTRLMLSNLSRMTVRLTLSILPQRRRQPIVVESETTSGSEMSADEDAVEDEIQISKNVGWRTKRQRNKALMEEESRLCIICMERNKCMLSMPCRHLCTCSECNETLRRYQSTCPLCRSNVNYSIHVY